MLDRRQRFFFFGEFRRRASVRRGSLPAASSVGGSDRRPAAVLRRTARRRIRAPAVASGAEGSTGSLRGRLGDGTSSTIEVEAGALRDLAGRRAEQDAEREHPHHGDRRRAGRGHEAALQALVSPARDRGATIGAPLGAVSLRPASLPEVVTPSANSRLTAPASCEQPEAAQREPGPSQLFNTGAGAGPEDAPVSEQCPSCGALAADQRYCLECGHRRGDPRLPFMDAVVFMDAMRRPAATAQPSSSPPPERRSRMTANASLIAGVGDAGAGDRGRRADRPSGERQLDRRGHRRRRSSRSAAAAKTAGDRVDRPKAPMESKRQRRARRGKAKGPEKAVRQQRHLRSRRRSPRSWPRA